MRPLLVGETVLGRYNGALARTAKGIGVRSSLTSLPRRLPAVAKTIVAVKDRG